jgi:hypothetical protein
VAGCAFRRDRRQPKRQRASQLSGSPASIPITRRLLTVPPD